MYVLFLNIRYIALQSNFLCYENINMIKHFTISILYNTLLDKTINVLND